MSTAHAPDRPAHIEPLMADAPSARPSLFHIDLWARGTPRQMGVRLFALGLTICLPMVLFYFEMGSDAGAYYVPMTRALAAGQFERAFHPTIPPLLPAVSGVISGVTGAPAFWSNKLVAATCFAAIAFPLLGVCRRWSGDPRLAVTAVLLCLCCPPMIKSAGYGELDVPKAFFMVTAVYFVCRFFEGPRWRDALLFGATCAGVTLVRGEGVLIALLAIALATWGEVWGRGSASGARLPRRSVVAVLVALVLVAPWLTYQWQQVGYPVTDARQVQHVRAALSQLLGVGDAPGPGSSPAAPGPDTTPAGPMHVLGALIDAVFPGYAPFLALGLFLWFAQRKTARERRLGCLLLLFFVCNALIFFHVDRYRNLNDRYVMQGLPLLLPWVALGVSAVVCWSCKHLSLDVRKTVLIGLAVGGNERAWGSMIKYWTDSEARAILDLRDWMHEHGKPLAKEGERLASTPGQYHNGRWPVIAVAKRRIGGMVACESAFMRDMVGRPGHTSMQQLLAAMQRKRVHFIAADTKAFAAYFPHFARRVEQQPQLIHLRTFGEHEPIRLYGYLPHLRRQRLPETVGRAEAPGVADTVSR